METAVKKIARLAAVWFVLVAVAVIGRAWQPTWRGEPIWNVTPMAGVALAAGSLFPQRALAATVPVAALAISNMILPGYDNTAMALVVFLATAWPVVLGRFVRSGQWTAIIGSALASSLVFFLTTNAAYWWLTNDYPHTMAGLGACFVAALPFYRWMPVGDVAWTAAIFAAMQAVASWSPAASRLTRQKTT